MKISNLAISNVKGNLYRYIMYLLSNAFSVTVFFIFANFVLHPNIYAADLNSASLKQGATLGMIACQVIIVVFTILFAGYSTSIFLKSRGKEFGLLSLYGMTRKQIRKYVLIESTFISVLSIAVGIATGIIFSKLFFMIMEVFLNISIPFNISFLALGITGLLFFILFQVINLLNIMFIRNKEIVDQIKTSKIPKVIPSFSKAKSILGILLIVIGYAVAWFVPPMLVPAAMLPVIFIVVTGTYFIFTQFSIAVANRILKNEKLLYQKMNLVAYSQMIFKLQDTAKVLFLAAVLGAFAFTATETMYSFFEEIPNLIGIVDIPQDMVILQRGDQLDDDIESILENKELDIKEKIKLDAVIIKRVIEHDHFVELFTLSNTDYNKFLSSKNRDMMIDVKEGEAIYLQPYQPLNDVYRDEQGSDLGYIDLGLEGESKAFNITKEIRESVITLGNVGYYQGLILNDKDFEEVLKMVDKDNKIKYTGIELEKFEKSYKTSIEIKDEIGDDYGRAYYSKSIDYRNGRNMYGLTLFIGLFISVLFLIASGSIIYFKLFNEIKQDGIEYGILRKIGTTQKEINKMATKQIGIIFFLPFVVSTLHSLFALKALSNLFMTNLFLNGLVVIMVYLIFQVIYFIIIRSIYIKRINYI